MLEGEWFSVPLWGLFNLTAHYMGEDLPDGLGISVPLWGLFNLTNWQVAKITLHDNKP